MILSWCVGNNILNAIPTVQHRRARPLNQPWPCSMFVDHHADPVHAWFGVLLGGLLYRCSAPTMAGSGRATTFHYAAARYSNFDVVLRGPISRFVRLHPRLTCVGSAQAPLMRIIADGCLQFDGVPDARLQVLNWEGGVHGIGFVRGTNSHLAPVPAGTVTHDIMHTTDVGLLDPPHISAFPLPLGHRRPPVSHLPPVSFQQAIPPWAELVPPQAVQYLDGTRILPSTSFADNRVLNPGFLITLKPPSCMDANRVLLSISILTV